MVKKIQLDILGLSYSQSKTGSYALVLGEVNSKRRLPIIIGAFEAQAIAIEIEKITPNRPMTHDLFKTFAKTFKINVHEVIITELKEGVFYAKIVCSDGKTIYEIDSRPSDAIAIAVRFNAPIYTYEDVLAEAGIVLTDYPEETKQEEASVKPKKITEQKGSIEQTGNPLAAFSLDEIKQMLKVALDEENYEKAAELRDELKKRGK
ncbi:MAG: hypothetical protein A3H98_10850 [Bacteroidetes bacterium RIFCSPLOWO2_02_FULL_36_8]|nr:MAG: hypothetical protein A3H98_10850 [Bacteroidetes bacterium RIFCSPLOWO2_02_FULL_36_8]OFY70683.1 MAG: hypothetical protein A3G23_08150 [Bacteroidetes bacterium RIFCSPLOWO2_12_FULL_37_12]